MFDLGTMGEIFIIALAVLILIGPKEMPTLLRALGRFTQKIKAMTATFRREVSKHIQDGELEEYTQQINASVLKKDPRKKSKKPRKTEKKDQGGSKS